MLRGGFSQPHTDILVNQQKVENVEEFTYLGSSVNYQGDMYHEPNCRIGKASVAFSQLGKIWKNKKFPTGSNSAFIIPMSY